MGEGAIGLTATIERRDAAKTVEAVSGSAVNRPTRLSPFPPAAVERLPERIVGPRSSPIAPGSGVDDGGNHRPANIITASAARIRRSFARDPPATTRGGVELDEFDPERAGLDSRLVRFGPSASFMERSRKQLGGLPDTPPRVESGPRLHSASRMEGARIRLHSGGFPEPHRLGLSPPRRRSPFPPLPVPGPGAPGPTFPGGGAR